MTNIEESILKIDTKDAEKWITVDQAKHLDDFSKDEKKMAELVLKLKDPSNETAQLLKKKLIEIREHIYQADNVDTPEVNEANKDHVKLIDDIIISLGWNVVRWDLGSIGLDQVVEWTKTDITTPSTPKEDTKHSEITENWAVNFEVTEDVDVVNNTIEAPWSRLRSEYEKAQDEAWKLQILDRVMHQSSADFQVFKSMVVSENPEDVLMARTMVKAYIIYSWNFNKLSEEDFTTWELSLGTDKEGHDSIILWKQPIYFGDAWSIFKENLNSLTVKPDIETPTADKDIDKKVDKKKTAKEERAERKKLSSEERLEKVGEKMWNVMEKVKKMLAMVFGPILWEKYMSKELWEEYQTQYNLREKNQINTEHQEVYNKTIIANPGITDWFRDVNDKWTRQEKRDSKNAFLAEAAKWWEPDKFIKDKFIAEQIPKLVKGLKGKQLEKYNAMIAWAWYNSDASLIAKFWMSNSKVDAMKAIDDYEVKAEEWKKIDLTSDTKNIKWKQIEWNEWNKFNMEGLKFDDNNKNWDVEIKNKWTSNPYFIIDGQIVYVKKQDDNSLVWRYVYDSKESWKDHVVTVKVEWNTITGVSETKSDSYFDIKELAVSSNIDQSRDKVNVLMNKITRTDVIAEKIDTFDAEILDIQKKIKETITPQELNDYIKDLSSKYDPTKTDVNVSPKEVARNRIIDALKWFATLSTKVENDATAAAEKAMADKEVADKLAAEAKAKEEADAKLVAAAKAEALAQVEADKVAAELQTSKDWTLAILDQVAAETTNFVWNDKKLYEDEIAFNRQLILDAKDKVAYESFINDWLAKWKNELPGETNPAEIANYNFFNKVKDVKTKVVV